MWKFWKRFGGKSSGASVSTSIQGSVADLRDKFYLEKHGTHGFPVGPSALTYDPYRHVMYIGTSNGELNMYGRPGVETSVNHFDNYKVLQILPFQSEPSIITVCSNNILNKWIIDEEDGRTQLVLKRTYKFQGGLAKTITVCCLPPYGECLFVGTLGGITYPMDTEFDGMSPEVLSWSRARAFLKYKGKDIPGEVRALIINPAHPKQLLIGYEHGYLEIWNAMTWKPDSLYGPYKDSGDIRTACWHSNGVQFLTSHSNGSLCIWSSNSSHGPIAVKKFYESDKLQEISRVLWPEEEFIVFNGGVPHDLVDGDSVSIWDGKDVVTLQTTSPVKGIHIIEDSQSDMDSGIVGASSEMDNVSTVRKVLILMLEQEILFLELRLPELLLLQPPYLNSLHNSPLKEVSVHSDVDREVWSIIHRVGKVQQEDVYRAPCKVWPIDGGVIEVSSPDNRDLLLTGHEDGTVKFWDIKDLSMRLMYEVRCAHFFSSPDSDFRTESPEPHLSSLRHIGFWDPRSDDDQLIVTSMKLCGEQLLVGFQGGHALLLSVNNQTADCTIILLKVSIMRDDPRQKTRGWQAPLEIRSDAIECSPGFQPSHGIHFFPAVPVTSLAIAKQQGLLAVGCVYGFAVVDYFKNETVFVHSTFDLDLDDPTTMSRMQSIRRSFRHSLQRVNIRHSMRGTQSINRSVRPGSMKLGSSPLGRSGSARPATYNRISSVRRSGMGGASTLTMEIRGKGAQPIDVQAAVQTPRRDSIRTLQFTAPTHISGSSLLHGLLVGTNQGAILGFTVDMPQERQRRVRSPIIMPVEKEFNARKNHAVLFAGIIDGNNYLLDVNDHGNFKTKGTHYLIMCTEDMLRVTNLPGQKKKFRVKFKQNEQDDFHIVSAHFIRIYGHSAILIMDSEGYISIYNLPELKLVYKENCVDASDAVGQRHFICSTMGLVLHQKSPSEFIRGSITDAARLDVQFTLPAKVSSPQAPVRFSRPLSDGPHLVEMDGTYYGLEIEAEITDGVGPIDSKTSFESTKSVQSDKSAHSVQSEKSAHSIQSIQSEKSVHSVQSDQSVHSVQSDQSVHSVQSDKSKNVNSVQPNKSVQSENSIQSDKSVRPEKSVRTEKSKSVELPDHYFTHHAPELKKGFKERAL